VAVAALCSLIAPAHADSALAEITGLRFDVIDLDPNDGIAPSFDLSEVMLAIGINGANDYYVPKTPGSRENEDATRHALASWDLTTGHLLASASSYKPGSQSGNADVTFYANGAGHCCNVYLSPNTRLEIHGTAHASITGSGMVFVGYQFIYPGGFLGDFKWNKIELSNGGPGTVSQDLDLSWSFDNVGSGSAYWEFALYASAYADPTTTAVPEPQLTLLAGLGLVTVLALRRGKSLRRFT